MEAQLCCFGQLDEFPLWSLCFFSQATRWPFRCNDNICLILLGSLEIEELCNHLGTTELNEDKIGTFVFYNSILMNYRMDFAINYCSTYSHFFISNNLVYVIFYI